MIKICVFVTSYFLFVSATANAAKIDCPSNSEGTYPNCVCKSESIYNGVHNLCPAQLNGFLGGCPKDSTGNFPNCICSSGKLYDHKDSICLDIDRSKCPKRSTGTPPHCKCDEKNTLDEIHWYCRPWYLPNPDLNILPLQKLPLCEPYQVWNENQKKCKPKPCPFYSIEPEKKFYPNCTFAVREQKPTCEDQGLSGVYPKCLRVNACPAFHYRVKAECVKVPCPKGWNGDHFPYCVYVQSHTCPPEFPGNWPYCNIYDAERNKTTTVPVQKNDKIERNIV